MPSTNRLTIEGAERILEKKYHVLDKGYIKLIDYMGGDNRIVQAARASSGKGTKTPGEDTALRRYLMRNKHTSPFEMVELMFQVKMPIFVARQWVRHRTANINEYSMRYSEALDEFYIPSKDRIRLQDRRNIQGSSDEMAPREARKKALSYIEKASETAYRRYKELLDNGIAREIARLVLPMNTYTIWYWKNDLHNIFHFLKLRTAKNAQWEIRQYAKQMAEIVQRVAPTAYEAFEDYVLNSVTFSPLERKVIEAVIRGEPPEQKAEELIENKFERQEFLEKLEKFDI